jgi:hypothetical protein
MRTRAGNLRAWVWRRQALVEQGLDLKAQKEVIDDGQGAEKLGVEVECFVICKHFLDVIVVLPYNTEGHFKSREFLR